MLQNIIDFINSYNYIFVIVSFVADWSVFFIAYNKIRSLKKLKIELPCGTFKIRVRDCNASNLTNLTSKLFYNGGNVPDDIRKKLIDYTAPLASEVTHTNNNNAQ